MNYTRLLALGCAVVLGGVALTALASTAVASEHMRARVRAVPAHAPTPASTSGSAGKATPAPKAEPVSPKNERSIMGKLAPEGYVDFNSYKLQSDGTAIVQALDQNNGDLKTLTVHPNGRITEREGWVITQPSRQQG